MVGDLAHFRESAETWIVVFEVNDRLGRAFLSRFEADYDWEGV